MFCWACPLWVSLHMFITPNDQIWQQLGLWLDINADAICQSEEMISLNDFAFVRFATIPKEREIYDDHGNWYRYWASADAVDNRHIMIDVYFKRYVSNTLAKPSPPETRLS